MCRLDVHSETKSKVRPKKKLARGGTAPCVLAALGSPTCVNGRATLLQVANEIIKEIKGGFNGNLGNGLDPPLLCAWRMHMKKHGR